MNGKLSNLVLVTLVGTIMGALLAGADRVDYRNPVRSAQEDEVKQLPGSNSSLSFKFYAGYLKAFDDNEPEQWLYYWFVESASSPANDPLVLWLSGGSGDSSLLAATGKMGPFRVNGSSIRSEGSDFSWNKLANMLFIEGPVGVGFSYSSEPLSPTDDSTARANYLALKSFMHKFPQYANNPFYLTGVSYAGVYLPTLGVLVDRDPQFNLKGIAIDSGLYNFYLQSSSMIFYAHHHGLLSSDEWKITSDSCCHRKEPTRKNCVFDKLHLYPKCKNHVTRIFNLLTSVYNDTLYNIYPPPVESRLPYDRSFGHKYWHIPSSETVCDERESVHLSSLLDNQQTKESIHVPAQLEPIRLFNYCRRYPYRPGGVGPQMKSLIASERNLTMLVFNGDVDMLTNFIGSRWFVESLGRKDLSGLHRWFFGQKKEVAGLVQHFDGITYATVRGAGHGTSSAKPRETFAIMERFLASHGTRNVYL